ncbi:D-ribitol-5-phosphate cytidylyltransferase isoform X3 [Hippoglossus stenolepis]|uniref:D-ribitol-5-phosphate cytidylyltransferase isoform X3 n=1 Tax=Hippoglossus stenolepis TaxID=195615 RepID=UPI001FAF74A2|nr:D-ribitol-5-phosphate cytidylyltransferase isoform X3 [Hippoglossus stenolepis]
MEDGRCDPDGPSHPRAFPGEEAGRSEPQPAELRVDFPVSVVLPAGGTGERTGLSTPKQFCSVLGRPLVSFTVQAFERVSWIQSVVVVVAKENMELMTDIVQRFQHRKVRVVAGGSTRHRSICNGVLALGEEEEEEEGRPASADRPKVVIIHDAVRPFVEEEFLYKIAVAAKEHGAAGAIRPLVSTVIATTSEGYLDHSLERGKYRASEMPQGFTYNVIHQAYQRVTYKRDLAAAESIIKESLSGSACVITGGSAGAVTLADALQKAAAALDLELDVVSDLTGDNGRYLSEECNFIRVSVNGSCLSEVKSFLMDLEAANRALLHPLVVIWVRLCRPDEPVMPEPAAIMDVASAAKLRNILLYGIRLHQSKDPERWERSVSRVAEITSALIRERSPALVGQLLQA